MLQIFYKMQRKYIKPILEKIQKYRRNRQIKEDRIPLYIEPPNFRPEEKPEESDSERGFAIIDFNIDNNGSDNE
jgi:hypothetical protein